MESINEQNCSGKTSWIKKIKEFESSKQKFIDIGPVDHQENDELWINFKKINKKFLQEKLIFKNLKKEYSANINNQIELIETLKNVKDKEKLPHADLQELKKKFNSIENVPYKK